MSRTRNLSDHLGFGYSTCMDHLCARPEQQIQSERDDRRPGNREDYFSLEIELLSEEYHDRGDGDVRQRQRNHPLPSEVHQLVEAEARERRAEPDVHQHEEHHLADENHRAEDAAPDAPAPQHAGGKSVAVDRYRPAAEEEA